MFSYVNKWRNAWNYYKTIGQFLDSFWFVCQIDPTVISNYFNDSIRW